MHLQAHGIRSNRAGRSGSATWSGDGRGSGGVVVVEAAAGLDAGVAGIDVLVQQPARAFAQARVLGGVVVLDVAV